MFQYQESYMDEKDIAEHQFRERTTTERSLKDFSQEDQSEKSIYDQYRE